MSGEDAPPAKLQKTVSGDAKKYAKPMSAKEKAKAAQEALNGNVIIQFQSSTGDNTGEYRLICCWNVLHCAMGVPTMLHAWWHMCCNSNLTLVLSVVLCHDTGPQLDVPAAVTPEQLETLLNGLLSHTERTPYSFHIEDAELAGALGSHLAARDMSVEAVLRVVYQPQVCECTAHASVT